MYLQGLVRERHSMDLSNKNTRFNIDTCSTDTALSVMLRDVLLKPTSNYRRPRQVEMYLCLVL